MNLKLKKVTLTLMVMLSLGTLGTLQAANEHPDAFIMTVGFTELKYTADLNFTIPTHPDFKYNYSVDCDSDGVLEATGVTGDYICNYHNVDQRTIRIEGLFPAIYFNNTGNKDKLLSIDQWGTNVWKTMNSAFEGTSNMVIKATDVPVLYDVTDMTEMFKGATVMTGDLNDWNVSTVESMSRMFQGDHSFQSSLSNWNVSNVRSMNSMFQNAWRFNDKIGGWDVSSVETMNSMFAVALNFNSGINSWDVSHVTNMAAMFFYASTFNRDLDSWDVSHVITMENMFTSASLFNQDIGDWDISSVTNMGGMFAAASAFNQNISNWDLSQVTNLVNMYKNVALSVSNYDALLDSLNERMASRTMDFYIDNSAYCLGESSRDILESDHNWVFYDAGKNCYLYFWTPRHITIEEGTTEVVHIRTSVQAVYSIVGGADASKFIIDANQNLLFEVAPNFSDHADRNGDNIYRVQILADDYEGDLDVQTIQVEVTKHPTTNMTSIITYLLF